MLSVYNKLFTKILDSSIWLAPDPVRIVWITFLASMDEDGYVLFASALNVARRANVSVDDANQAISVLENPDEYSSDTDNEGRRIERIPGGWIVLNAEKYRRIATRLLYREKVASRVSEWREKNKKRKLVKSAKGANKATNVTLKGVTNTESNAIERQCNATSPACNTSVTPSDQIRSEDKQSKEKGSVDTDPKKKDPGVVDPLCATVDWIIFRWNEIEGVKHVDEDPPLETKKKIKTRIREHPKKAWWDEKFFSRVNASDFLRGKSNVGWSATLDWACGPKNMTKILTDSYLNTRQNGAHDKRGPSGGDAWLAERQAEREKQMIDITPTEERQ